MIQLPVVTFPEGEPAIYCRACGVFHEFAVRAPNVHGQRWAWNNDVFSPTFEPSVVTRTISHRDRRQYVCHAWVVNGRITYLPDSTHHLKGQTVDLAPPP